MQGKHSGIFTETITHLVTTEVGSAKYHVNKRKKDFFFKEFLIMLIFL